MDAKPTIDRIRVFPDGDQHRTPVMDHVMHSETVTMVIRMESIGNTTGITNDQLMAAVLKQLQWVPQ